MASIERTFSLHVPSSTENLSMIRDFVKSIGTHSGMGDMDVARLEMAVDEACANVMEHAYDADSTKEVSIRATVDENSVQIEVIDTGKGFDPAAVEQLKLEDLVSAKRTGGLGMRLIKSFMDEVHYEMLPGVKNELRMVKRLMKADSNESGRN
jgi:serine/threonine-protein kinase RsbW